MKKFFTRIFYLSLITIILGGLIVGGVVGYFSMDLPKISSLNEVFPIGPFGYSYSTTDYKFLNDVPDWLKNA